MVRFLPSDSPILSISAITRANGIGERVTSPLNTVQATLIPSRTSITKVRGLKHPDPSGFESHLSPKDHGRMAQSSR
jgi:hypothetical protein